MGNCLGITRKQGGHRLGAESSQPKPSTTPNEAERSSSNNREMMAAAAERRRLEAEHRGVKDGGKLSKQLAEQKKQNPLRSEPETMPERIVWD